MRPRESCGGKFKGTPGTGDDYIFEVVVERKDMPDLQVTMTETLSARVAAPANALRWCGDSPKMPGRALEEASRRTPAKRPQPVGCAVVASKPEFNQDFEDMLACLLDAGGLPPRRIDLLTEISGVSWRRWHPR